MNVAAVYSHQHEALPRSSGLVRDDFVCRCILRRSTAPPHSAMGVTSEGRLVLGRCKIIHHHSAKYVRF